MIIVPHDNHNIFVISFQRSLMILQWKLQTFQFFLNVKVLHKWKLPTFQIKALIRDKNIINNYGFPCDGEKIIISFQWFLMILQFGVSKNYKYQ